jgi:hypothetical protein
MTRRHTDRLNPARTEADLQRIVAMVVELRHAWPDVVDGGKYPPRTESNGRGKGFEDIDPTYTAVTSGSQIGLRRAARQASRRIAEARERLEDAATTLHSALLRTDPEVMAEFVEKRSAVLDRIPRV